jgi:hypothetical protein
MCGPLACKWFLSQETRWDHPVRSREKKMRPKVRPSPAHLTKIKSTSRDQAEERKYHKRTNGETGEKPGEQTA